MRTSVLRSGIATIAMASLAASLAACGGGSTTASAPVVATAHTASGNFSLGLIAAAPADIAKLTLIRHAASTQPLPAAVDLSAKMPAVGDQGQEGSCVAWATAYAMRGYEARQDVWSSISPKTIAAGNNFSAAFIYNLLNGGHDNGLAIPWALTLMEQKGVATLADMPYVAGQYTTQPSSAAFADALHYKLTSYGYIAPTDLNSMKVQLAAGIPVILAFSVYNNFFYLGANQIYSSVSGGYAGGHAVTIVGYDDTKGAVEIINSWGPYWATAGYGWISYAALKQIAVEAYSAIDDHGPPVMPSPLPTPTLKPSPSPSPTLKPSPSPSPTLKPSPSPSPTLKPSPSPSPTLKPSPSPSPTLKPSPSPSPSPTPTLKPSPSPSPSSAPSATPTK